MSTLNIQLLCRKSRKKSLNYRYLLPDLEPWLTLSGLNYPCLEQFCMVPKMFEPLKFDCNYRIQTKAPNKGTFFNQKVFVFFLLFQENILWYSFKAPHQSASNEYPQRIFWFLFVLRFYGSVNQMGSCQAGSVYLTSLLLSRLASVVQILSPETDNCPSWISGKERMTIENISWSISTKECCQLSWGRTRSLLITSRTDIQLILQGRLYIFLEK